MKEEGIWKIDKQGFADQIIQDVDQKDKELEEIFKRQ